MRLKPASGCSNYDGMNSGEVIEHQSRLKDHWSKWIG